MGPKPKPLSWITSSDGATLCSEWLKSSEDIVWGLAGDNFTRTFYRDAAIARGEKWICLKDSKPTEKAIITRRNENESTMEVIFQIPNATKADSGEYTFGTGDSKALKMKTNITVRIIDKLKSFQPWVTVDKSDKVIVKWTPPVTDLAIIGYDLECKEEGEKRWTRVTPYTVKDCSFCDDDIAPNKVYIYRVIAYNKIGHPWLSQPSNEFPFKTELPAPQAPKLNASNTTSVTVGEPLELCVLITETCDGVTCTWKKDGKNLVEGYVEDGKSVYRIEKATLENAGEYTFTAMRGSKRSQMTMNVVVQEKKQENVWRNCIYYGPALLAVVICAIFMAVYPNSSPNDTNLATEIEKIKRQLQLLSKPSGMDANKWKIGLDDFDEGLTQKWNAVGERLGQVETNAMRAAQERNNVKDILVNVTTIEALLETHTKEIQSLTNWVTEFETTFDGEFVQLNRAEKGETRITKKEIAGLLKKINPIINELKNFEEKYQALEEELYEAQVGAKKMLGKLLGNNEDIIDSVRSIAANRESAQIVIAIVFIIEVGLGFWIYRIHLKVGSKGGVGLSSSKTAKEVLENIPRSVSLDRSICVIGFNNSMSDFNRGMITGALQGMNVSVNYTVVTRHEQLQGLPHCRLYVMCTEFTEKHDIIEEQGLGLGDLKRCTYDVIQRLHAIMVIIYIHDPGSRSLPQGHLFNNKILRVSSQPELVRLREMKRFFSIYDKLTDNQISSFKDIVYSCIELKN